METIKVVLFSSLIAGLVLVGAIIGYSKVPDPDHGKCPATYRLDGTWKPIGWRIEDGFPRTDCTFPADRFVEEDGTWDWK